VPKEGLQECSHRGRGELQLHRKGGKPQGRARKGGNYLSCTVDRNSTSREVLDTVVAAKGGGLVPSGECHPEMNTRKGLIGVDSRCVQQGRRTTATGIPVSKGVVH
jgi:hypothetical protein